MPITIPVQDNYFILEGYEFSTVGLNHKIYDDEWFRGIVFYLPEGTYDVFLNKVGWPRIIITKKDGFPQDIPFNESTLKLLPESIKVRKLDGRKEL